MNNMPTALRFSGKTREKLVKVLRLMFQDCSLRVARRNLVPAERFELSNTCF